MATLSKTFKCIDCKEEYRSGMDVETDMYLNPKDNDAYSGHRCVYCYNKKLINPANAVDPQWFIQVADRLEHEAEIEEFVNLYFSEMLPKVQYSYYTNHKYQLTVHIMAQWPIGEGDIAHFFSTLKQDGMSVGELRGVQGNWHTEVDFQDHTSVFTR